MRATLLALARFVVAHRVAVGAVAFMLAMVTWKVAAKSIMIGYGWLGFIIALVFTGS